MFQLLRDVFSVFLSDKSSKRFALSVILGFAFSISVILSTIGIMDGFDISLKRGLKLASGDFTIISSRGFFDLEKTISSELSEYGISEFSGVVKTEAFLVGESDSLGVLTVGVENSEYSKITGLDVPVIAGEIIIGKELAKRQSLKVGETISLAFASSNSEIEGLPELFDFKISNIISHGLYQKDLRIVYVNRADLQEILEIDNRVNMVTAKAKSFGLENDFSSEYLEQVERQANLLDSSLGYRYQVRPYWSEFAYLFRAVKAEKVMITVILQIVVVIAIFNVVAFIIFINEKKVQEIFLFRALGMGNKKLQRMWYVLSLGIWLGSCLFSLVFVFIFDMALRYLPVFELPGNVYQLAKLHLEISTIEYTYVFSGALVWMLFLSWITLKRIYKKSILASLRQEFS